MKTKITACLILTLVLLSGMSQAQQRKRIGKKKSIKNQLTDVQKMELKAARLEFAKSTLDVRNELNELQAHQRTLMSTKKLNEKNVFDNIDKITELKKTLMQERINMRLTSFNLLGENQEMHRKMKRFDSKRRNDSKDCVRKPMRKAKRRGMGEQGKKRMMKFLDLSEKQQDEMASLKEKHKKACQNLREEMMELRLKQKHLLNDEKPNKSEISANIDRIALIQNQLAKKRFNKQEEIRTVLDQDQLILFLAKGHGKHKNRKGRMHKSF